MNLFFFPEMQELPYGTGSLYVTDPDNPHLLKRENRSLNATERAEAVAVQYLTLGGHERFTRLPASQHKPVRVFSSIHTGPGQQVFGYTEKQRADLTLVFDLSTSPTEKRMELHYFNYHGYHWHYEGHMDACPSTEGRYESMKIVPQSQLMDDFRRAYAQAMSQVFFPPRHLSLSRCLRVRAGSRHSRRLHSRASIGKDILQRSRTVGSRDAQRFLPSSASPTTFFQQGKFARRN